MNTATLSAEQRMELKKKYKDEQVFVVPTLLIPEIEEGFSLQRETFMQELVEHGVFANRWEVEYNPRLRQPIPYIILRHDGKYFTMSRLGGAGEARLHGKLSMGIGGHINPVDAEEGKLYSKILFHNGMKRELKEEVSIRGFVEQYSFYGVINDLSNDVSRDHIGLVFVVDVDTDQVEVLEVDKYVGGWHTLDELEKAYDRMESWTQIMFDIIKLGYLE